MPVRDERTRATTRVGKHQTTGRMNVIYRDTKGNSALAAVVGPGTGSGLKLRIGSRNGGSVGKVVDNVAAATTPKQTNVYFARGRVS